jgi:hypothetical protein
MSDFFNPENGGLSPLYGWMGQVVDEKCWSENHANSDGTHKLHTSQDVAGYGYRYKVRIFGRDTELKNCSDDQLEMADVALPVTAGSGHAGSVQTPNIKQGCYVFGFYKDGKDGTEPCIFGILPNNAQTVLFPGDTPKNFMSRTGFVGRDGQVPVSTSHIPFDYSAKVLPITESINANIANIRDLDKNIDGTRKFFLPTTINCEGPSGELQGLQRTIKQLLIDVKRTKSLLQSGLGRASDLQSNLTNLINEATLLSSALMKSLITKIRGFVVNWFNKEATTIFDILPPNLRPNAAEGVEKATNTIECLFNKIISRLMSILQQLLLSIIDRYINAPLCAIENFVGNFFSTILGELTSGITNAISGILGPVGDIASIIFQALDIFVGILNFLSCEEDLDCKIVDEWSFFTGSTSHLDLLLGPNNANKIRNAANGGSAPPCNTNQLPCGPPKISFFGNGSSPALGNPIISGAGYIMGVDLVTGGRYTSTPDIRIIDECGSGAGAVLVPIMRKVNDQESTVDKVVVFDPGFKYLNSTNGKTGGDGITFSEPSDTIIVTPKEFPTIPEGTPIFIGDSPLVINDRPLFVEGTPGNPLTSNGLPLISGGNPVIIDDSGAGGGLPAAGLPGGGAGLPGAGGGLPAAGLPGGGGSSGNGIGLIPITIGGLPLTSGGRPLTIRSTLPGVPITVDNNPVTIGGVPVTVGVDTSIVPGSNEIGNAINVYPENKTIPVYSGQIGYFPSGSTVEVINSNGDVVQIIQGLGQLTPIEITQNGFITTPNARTESFDQNSETYPILISIDDLAVLNEGFNYSPGDKIEIIPDNGAVVEPMINEFGNIIDVNVVSSGIGFTDIPQINVISETGINAVLVPVFNFQQIDNLDDASQPSFDYPVVNVVDCVGKLQFKK